ncbi:hypothetical protein Droror1_Dr00027135 [Drosera rotundifolia]
MRIRKMSETLDIMKGGDSINGDHQRFFGCYLLTSLSPLHKGHTYIGFTVNPCRRIRQHNGELRSGGVWKTKKKRPWEMALCIYGFPTQVAALQFEWAWQHPRKSLAVREAASSFKSLFGLTNNIKLAYTMLTLHTWQTMRLTLNFFSTKYINHITGCPALPPQMKIQICFVDDLPCYSMRAHAVATASQEDHCSNDIIPSQYGDEGNIATAFARGASVEEALLEGHFTNDGVVCHNIKPAFGPFDGGQGHWILEKHRNDCYPSPDNHDRPCQVDILSMSISPSANGMPPGTIMSAVQDFDVSNKSLVLPLPETLTETKSEPPKNGRPGLRRLKKKHQSNENESDGSKSPPKISKHRRARRIMDSDDEDQRTISSLHKSKKALVHGASIEDKVVEAGKTVGTDNKNADKSMSTNNGTTSRQDEESEDNQEVKPVKKKRKARLKEEKLHRNKADEAINSRKQDLSSKGEPQELADPKQKDPCFEDTADEHMSSVKIIKKKRWSNNENMEAETPTLIKQERNTPLLENGGTNLDSNASNLIKMPNGLVIKDLVVGEADQEVASSGKKVTIQYSIKLKDGGRIVRSSVESASHKFRLGKGRAMEGLDLGINGMQVGGRRRLVIPPALGFGSEDNDLGVPPNSWLVIDVDLIRVR